jgi:hypothetical protein
MAVKMSVSKLMEGFALSYLKWRKFLKKIFAIGKPLYATMRTVLFRGGIVLDMSQAIAIKPQTRLWPSPNSWTQRYAA